MPETGAPFNSAVRFGPFVFVSGLPPFDAEYSRRLAEARATGSPIPPMPELPFESQVRIVLDHLKVLLEAAGSSMDCLLKTTVYLKDQSQMEVFDRIYREYFSDPSAWPARTRIQAGRTPLDCGLEVEAIGYIPGVPFDGESPAPDVGRKP